MAEQTTFVRDGERWLAPMGGLVAEVIGGELRIYQQGGTAVAHIPLAPRINGGATTLQGAWHLQGGVLTATLVEHAPVEVRVWTAQGRVHYRVYCPIPGPILLEYFTGATFRGPQWHTFTSDAYDRSFSKKDARAVPVATAVDIRAQKLQGGPETWYLTPASRACALQYDGGWLGVAVPGAIPAAATTFAVDESEQFRLAFEQYRQANADNRGPEVVFTGGLDDPYQALDALAAGEQGAHGPTRTAPWWPRPLFCTWGEQTARAQQAGSRPEMMLTADAVRQWVGALRDKLGHGDFNVIIDYGWAAHLGDFTGSTLMGGDAGLRALIDELHAHGHRVLLWVAPYALERSSEAVASHQPEGYVLDAQGKPATGYQAPLVRDITHPAMREQVRAGVQHLLSPAGLDADGLKLDYLYDCPDPRTTRAHDPTWGFGDELAAKVLRLIGEAARAVKGDALITVSGAMPYLQGDAGAIRLNDNFAHDAAPWWKRARVVARTLPGTLIDADGWPLFREDAAAHWVTSPVYGIPALYHLTELSDRAALSDEDHRLLAVCWAVYANAPAGTDQRVVVNPEEGVFERYDADGALAAQCLDNTVLITAGPGEIRACAVKEQRVELPITEAQLVADAHLVSLQGDETPVDLGDLQQRPLATTIPAAGRTGQYLRVRLRG